MCSLFQLPGFPGIATGTLLVCVVWLIAYLSLEKGPFNMDFPGEVGSFLKMLKIYCDIAKVVIGFASATIAALIGTSILNSNGAAGSLLKPLASPLFVLAFCILWGVCFMAFETTDYEAYRHRQIQYTRFRYSRNLALGYSCLLCFTVGYLWLIVVVTSHR